MLVRLIAVCSLFLLKSIAGAHEFTLPEDVTLPEGVTAEMVQEASKTAFASVLRKKFEAHNNVESRRKLQTYECNKEIAVISAYHFRREIREAFGGELDTIARIGLEISLVSRLRTDLQVWKVCGRCSDYEPGTVACREEDYGFDALHSGLLIAPYSIWRKRILSGTRPVNIVMPAAGRAATENFVLPITESPAFFLPTAVIMSSASKSYTLLPDTIGFGESRDFKRAFNVYQSIATATAPLITAAENLVQEETDCSSAMADAYTVLGYSEGAYSAVVVADMLDRMKKTVIALHPGGGPYRLSSTQMKFVINEFTEGDPSVFFILLAAHLGAAYSSTTTDASNFGDGQDLLSSNLRDAVVDVANEDDWFAPICYTAFGCTGPNSPMPIDVTPAINQAFIKLFLDNPDDPEPCTKADSKTDKLCGALIENDVIEILEKAKYPVFLCHADEDELVAFENVPDLSTNDNLQLNVVSGTHLTAVFPCLNDAIPFWIDDENVQDFKVKDKTRRRCKK